MVYLNKVTKVPYIERSQDRSPRVRNVRVHLVSEQFDDLEEWAAACGLEHANKGLRIARMAFIRPHAIRSSKQANMQSFLSPSA